MPIEFDINVSQGRLTIKTAKSIQCRVASVALLTLFLFSASSNGKAQSSQDGPSFQDTTGYITNLLASHGCANFGIISPRGNTVSGRHCYTITKADTCSVDVKYVATTDVNDPYVVVYTFDLSQLDPTSVTTGAELNTAQLPPGTQVPNNGLQVQASKTSGGIGLGLAVDSQENATHLINALSHAITLCGGKKAAF
jgi:hypothetical protein